jgi:hypothetical protein
MSFYGDSLDPAFDDIGGPMVYVVGAGSCCDAGCLQEVCMSMCRCCSRERVLSLAIFSKVILLLVELIIEILKYCI